MKITISGNQTGGGNAFCFNLSQDAVIYILQLAQKLEDEGDELIERSKNRSVSGKLADSDKT